MKNFILALIVCTTFFTGCSSLPERHAKVIDSAVEGLEFQCAGMIEYTPKDGSLSCQHMPLGFKVGEIKLGIVYKIPEDGIIFPQDIAGVSRNNLTNSEVVKLTVLLQSLDEDKNPENGIKISKKTREKLKEFIDLKEISLAELKDLVEAQLGRPIEFKEPKSAIEHLERSMRSYNINIPNIDLEGLD